MKKSIIKLIDLYQVTPINTHHLCKFHPTCSEYSKIAIERFGLIKGSKLTLKRLLKCNMFTKPNSIDLVPEK